MKKKMVILYIVTMMIILILVIFVMQTMGFNIIKQQTTMRLAALASSKATQVSSLVEQDFERVSLIASRTQMRDSLMEYEATEDPEASRNRMKDIIKDAAASVDAVRMVEIVTLEGVVAASTDESRTGRGVHQDPFFRYGQKSTYLSDFFWDPQQNPYYTLSMPLYDTAAEKEEAQHIIGVLRVEISLERMMSILGDYTGLGNTGEIILLSRDNNQMICLNPLRQCGNKPLQISVLLEDEDVFDAYHSVNLDGRQWGILVKIDTAEVMAPYQVMYRYLSAFMIGLVILGSFIILVGIRYSFQGIEKLLEGAVQFGKGNLAHSIEVKEKGEIRKLADSYNEMAGKLKAIKDRIENLSFTDQLTGIGNRRLYEEELIRMDAPRHMPLTIVMGDVNGLKLVNDAFGHHMGDQLLRRVADVMVKMCHKQHEICRLGGDEFVIFMPRTSTGEAEKQIQSMKENLSEVKVAGIELSVSFGAATKSSSKESIQETIRQAEEIMYGRKLMESKTMRDKTIETIITTFLNANESENRHAHQVSKWCCRFGTIMKFSQERTEKLVDAGLLHDLGKIAIESRTLNKAEPLTEKEWLEIKRHPENGYRILGGINQYKEVAECILSHHENFDGSGYPRRLKREEIPVESRVIAIAESYDAMVHPQPYRKEAMTKEEAVEELRTKAGTQFDPELVDLFVEKILTEE